MRPHFSSRGGAWVIAQSVLLLATLASGVAFSGQWQNPWSVAVGGAVFAAGAAMGAAGVRALGANRTAFPKPLEGGSLVQGGAYRLVRHPLYCAVLLAAAGWGLLWQSGPALAGAVVLAVFFDAKAGREERWLEEKFPEYAGYRKRTRKLVPWIY